MINNSNYTKILAMLVGALTLLRLWLCTRFGLIADEAYYWLWARHLDWCYYSKGPVVAWMIWLGTRLFGHHEFGVRSLSVMLGSGTALLVYQLGRRLFSPRVGFWAAVTAMVTPLLVIGSMLMTIDPISVFLWFAAANVFWRAKDSATPWPWLATGLLVGLGMLAKYTNVALLISFALFLAWMPGHRRKLVRPGFWIMTGSALLCLAPVLWWNSRNGWITFVHLQERGALDRAWQFSLGEFLGFLGGQCAAYTPFVAAGVIVALLHGGVRRSAPAAYRYVAALTLPLLLFYGVMALNDEGEANWTAPAMISGIVLLAATWCGLAQRHRWARVTAWVALTVSGVAMAGLLTWSTGRVAGEPTPLRKLFERTRGWPEMAAGLERLRVAEGADIVICHDRGVASRMAFYMPGQPSTYIPSSPKIENQFSLWPGYRERPAGTDAVFVIRSGGRAGGLQDKLSGLRDEFESVEPVGTLQRTHDGRVVRQYDLFVCRDLRSEP